MTSRPAVLVPAIGAMLLLAGCSESRSVPVVSECPTPVRVHFEGTAGNTWEDPVVVDAEGTSLGVTLDADRVWFESTDGEVLNEVSLTPDQLADADVDFPPLVIRAEHCARLEAAS